MTEVQIIYNAEEMDRAQVTIKAFELGHSARLIDAAQARTWSPSPVPGAVFHKGKLLKRSIDSHPQRSMLD